VLLMEKTSLPRFEARAPGLRRGRTTTLQLNVGRKCNQACHHCHVGAGPKRTEMIDRRTAERVVELLAATSGIDLVDITGGAPELSEHFRWVVGEARRMGKRVIDRCNLTILFEPGQQDLAQFLAAHRVEVVASLPCYSAANVDRQRGRGVFDRSIEALLQLNALGYGRAGSGLQLDLVYNPLGPSLPPAQGPLEARYKRELADAFGIVFNRLYTLTNMPIQRFAAQLEREGRLHEYLGLLVNHFNPATVPELMCRTLVSVGYDGRLFDCDFNQMLEVPLGAGARTVWDVDALELDGVGDLGGFTLLRLHRRRRLELWRGAPVIGGVALLLVGGLAFANGANDVSKGIATLIGSGLTDYRRAVAWGTLCTIAGALAGAVIAGAMLATFGAGIWTVGGEASLIPAIATLTGASGWVLWATWRGLPVSTTHALVGALAGAGAAAWGMAGVSWEHVAMKMALPLLLGPLLALLGAAVLTRMTRTPEGRPPATIDRLHWLASGATSFARAVNDAPKLVALGLGAVAVGGAGSQPVLFAVVACGMGLGSWFAGRRITQVLAERITAMSHREGLASNAVTSVLVAAGGIFGLPLATTHVAGGALIGMGSQRSGGAINWGTVRQIAGAWLITVPAAAAMGALAQLVLAGVP
jgi:radical SAM/Cys-rich protein